MERRSFLRLAATIVAASGLSPRFASTLLAQTETSERFATPPGKETREVSAAIDQVIEALESRRAKPSDILSDPKYMPLHEWSRFRLVIRDHASPGVLTIVTPEEPGTRLTLNGTVLDANGKAVAKARVYLYQTSAKGWYSEKAPHISGNSGDQRYARLFGYLIADEQGRFEVKTIRPAGYPDSDLPAHIHVEVRSGAEDGRALVTEVRFANDPRLTPEARQRSEQERFVICDVKRKSDGEEVTAVLRTHE